MKTSERITQEIDHVENISWVELSLQNALRNMENDTFPEYQPADFKEKWQ